MIVSITGAGGFIGQALMDAHLKRGDVVRVLSRSSGQTSFPEAVQVFQGDLTRADVDLTSFVKDADVLYHCAAEIRDERRMQLVNVEGTNRLIQFASGQVKRWVQLSSVGAYGSVFEGVLTEESAEQPLGVYEETKTQADNILRQAFNAGGFELVILRPAIVYGETMKNQSIFQLMRMIERGWFFFIGPPGASANYVHVQDVVSALLLCGEKEAATGETFNLSGWGTIEQMIYSLADGLNCKRPSARLPVLVMYLFATMMGLIPKSPLTNARIKALTGKSKYSIEKIEQLLGFKLQVPLDQGMKQFAQKWKLSS